MQGWDGLTKDKEDEFVREYLKGGKMKKSKVVCNAGSIL